MFSRVDDILDDLVKVRWGHELLCVCAYWHGLHANDPAGWWSLVQYTVELSVELQWTDEANSRNHVDEVEYLLRAKRHWSTSFSPMVFAVRFFCTLAFKPYSTALFFFFQSPGSRKSCTKRTMEETWPWHVLSWCMESWIWRTKPISMGKIHWLSSNLLRTYFYMGAMVAE